MKGIILAGGMGSRLYPVTSVISKQLLPVFDKPMIYYPLSALMLAGITDILIVARPTDIFSFRSLIGAGEQFGISVRYVEQKNPNGIPEAFVLAEEFLEGGPAMLALGDNIFFGSGFSGLIGHAISTNPGATAFSYSVNDPERFGVVELDKGGTPISIEEKPASPRSNKALVGLYVFDNRVVEFANSLKPSARGELEIIELLHLYLARKEMEVVELPRGYAWLDSGTADSLLSASLFVKTIRDRQGLSICCPEEIAFNKGLISKEQLLDAAGGYCNSYGDYLEAIALRGTK